jgi:hypothetical protein
MWEQKIISTHVANFPQLPNMPPSIEEQPNAANLATVANTRRSTNRFQQNDGASDERRVNADAEIDALWKTSTVNQQRTRRTRQTDGGDDEDEEEDDEEEREVHSTKLN